MIRESSSPFVLVWKGGKLRVGCDYLVLNAETLKEAYPLPQIQEAHTVLKDAKYFCSLDLAHGFNQIAADFQTGTGGLYEYFWMPFVLL